MVKIKLEFLDWLETTLRFWDLCFYVFTFEIEDLVAKLSSFHLNNEIEYQDLLIVV
jgi:hypothetical protein